MNDNGKKSCSDGSLVIDPAQLCDGRALRKSDKFQQADASAHPVNESLSISAADVKQVHGTSSGFFRKPLP
jgi:hypothetical protein